MLIWLPTALLTAVLMDLWAALLHGRVWHRWLWKIHRSHHSQRKGRFEHNDALSVLHAPIAIAFILYGCVGPVGPLREVLYGIGIGATAFGVAYLLVHDGVVHRRLPVRALGKLPWLRDIIRAHRVHHATGGPPYGLFFGPRELKRHHEVAAAQSRDPIVPLSTAQRRA